MKALAISESATGQPGETSCGGPRPPVGGDPDPARQHRGQYERDHRRPIPPRRPRVPRLRARAPTTPRTPRRTPAMPRSTRAPGPSTCRACRVCTAPSTGRDRQLRPAWGAADRRLHARALDADEPRGRRHTPASPTGLRSRCAATPSRGRARPRRRTGAQAANLDNNSGAEVTDESPLTDATSVTGLYVGLISTAAQLDTTRTAQDLALRKQASAGGVAAGNDDHLDPDGLHERVPQREQRGRHRHRPGRPLPAGERRQPRPAAARPERRRLRPRCRPSDPYASVCRTGRRHVEPRLGQWAAPRSR